MPGYTLHLNKMPNPYRLDVTDYLIRSAAQECRVHFASPTEASLPLVNNCFCKLVDYKVAGCQVPRKYYKHHRHNHQ